MLPVHKIFVLFSPVRWCKTFENHWSNSSICSIRHLFLSLTSVLFS